MDGDHVALLRPGCCRAGLLLPGAVEERQLARVPEVADATDDEEGEDDEERDHAVAAAAAGLLAALGAALGELEPVDDVFGVVVRLVDEGELLGAVVRVGRPALGPARFGDPVGARRLRLCRGGAGGGRGLGGGLLGDPLLGLLRVLRFVPVGGGLGVLLLPVRRGGRLLRLLLLRLLVRLLRLPAVALLVVAVLLLVLLRGRLAVHRLPVRVVADELLLL